MSSLKGKRILIFQQRGWALTIGHFLAKKLQAEGCRLAALTLKKTTHNFVLNQKEIQYEYIFSNDEVFEDPLGYLDQDDYPLEEICESLGIVSVWPPIMSLRNLVYSYKDKFRYAFRQNASDEFIITYAKAAFKSVKFIFETFKPDIIIAPNYVSLVHIFTNLYAKRQGVKMIAITDSKIQGYFIFTGDYLNRDTVFSKRLDLLNRKAVESENLNQAKNYIKEFRFEFKQPKYFIRRLNERNQRLSYLQKIRQEISPYYHAIKVYFKQSKNRLSSIGYTLDDRSPRLILRDFYCQKKYKKFAENFDYYPLEKIDKCVYFPLQFQPEASIDVASPYFSNQIETSRRLAISMPGDYVLVVKEHPGMVGLRPPSYLEKVARTPNVKLVDYRIFNDIIIKKADLIVSPNSTSLAEAAFLQKPAIQLGGLGNTLLLPNVHQHTDMSTITLKMEELIKMDLSNKEYERKLENFVAAVYDVGFNVDYFLIWEKGSGKDKEELWEIYKRELESYD